MPTIQTKIELKKKKRIIELINHISGMDETTINFFGDKSDPLSKKIKIAFEKALSGRSNLNEEILKMQGLSGRKFRVMMNNLIKEFKIPKYLEIGSWLGSTACSVCFNNKLKITCIDNWSQNFSPKLKPKKVFKTNIKKYITKEIEFKIIEKDFRKVNYKTIKDINIYLYDGGHHYKDHFDSLKLVLPALSKKFILIVDDWNWDQVRKGTIDAINEEKLKIVSNLEIRTTLDGSSSLITGERSDWHQGCAFLVLKK